MGQTVGPSDTFKGELDRLTEKYAPKGNRFGFVTDIMTLLTQAIQAGRQAAQGADGFVMCGRCNKVVHQCPKE